MRPAAFSRRFALVVSAFLASLALAACQTGESGPRGPAPSATDARSETAGAQIVVLGDSLTAGYGLPAVESYPALLQKRLDREGYGLEILNAGVSGDTTAGGLRRIDWVLHDDVRILILALGANDGMRGLPVDAMKHNLESMIERAEARKIDVLLAGMEAPPNMGSSYTSQFKEAFEELAREHDLDFFPFLLQDVAGDPRFNQRDGIHPNAEGARIMADNVWTFLQPMLVSASSR
jgi:acyl-CoA thioesterase-1